jgi:hypothetical protein
MVTRNIPKIQQIEILTKMSDGKDHLRYEFQSNQKAKQNGELMEKRGLPHSTLHKRWNELLEEGSIIKTHSGEATKKGDEKVCGRITFLGFVKLLTQRNLNGIDKIIGEFLPLMKKSIPVIMKKFDKKTISDVFRTVCNNIEISYHKDGTKAPLIPLRGDLLMKQWVSIYELRIKTKIYSSHITFSKIVYLSGDDRKKQTIEKEMHHATTEMQKIFIGYFIFEMMMRYIRYDETSHNESNPEDMTCIFQDDPLLLKLQRDFMDKLKFEIDFETNEFLKCGALVGLNN